MTARFNLVAAVLGLAVATAAVTANVGNASAKTIIHKTTIHTTAIAHAPHRVVLGQGIVGKRIVGQRIVKHVRVVRRAPAVVKVVRTAIPATGVRLVKRPLPHKQVVAHRVTFRKTIIR